MPEPTGVHGHGHEELAGHARTQGHPQGFQSLVDQPSRGLSGNIRQAQATEVILGQVVIDHNPGHR